MAATTQAQILVWTFTPSWWRGLGPRLDEYANTEWMRQHSGNITNVWALGVMVCHPPNMREVQGLISWAPMVYSTPGQLGAIFMPGQI